MIGEITEELFTKGALEMEICSFESGSNRTAIVSRVKIINAQVKHTWVVKREGAIFNHLSTDEYTFDRSKHAARYYLGALSAVEKKENFHKSHLDWITDEDTDFIQCELESAIFQPVAQVENLKYGIVQLGMTCSKSQLGMTSKTGSEYVAMTRSFAVNVDTFKERCMLTFTTPNQAIKAFKDCLNDI